MNIGPWLRALDVLGGLVDMTRRVTGAAPRERDDALTAGAGSGQLEARLAGVVVAALREAFDRDRTRLDLERTQIEAERERAERALRLELRRQATGHALTGVRLTGTMAFLIWLASAILLVWADLIREGPGRFLLGAGWLALMGTIGCAFVSHQKLLEWMSDVHSPDTNDAPPRTGPMKTMPWLLLAGLGLTAVSLLIGN
jgi:hypothetical protein